MKLSLDIDFPENVSNIETLREKVENQLVLPLRRFMNDISYDEHVFFCSDETGDIKEVWWGMFYHQNDEEESITHRFSFYLDGAADFVIDDCYEVNECDACPICKIEFDKAIKGNWSKILKIVLKLVEQELRNMLCRDADIEKLSKAISYLLSKTK